MPGAFEDTVRIHVNTIVAARDVVFAAVRCRQIMSLA